MVHMEDMQKGIPIPSSLLRAIGCAHDHQFLVLFDTGSLKDLILRSWLSSLVARQFRCTSRLMHSHPVFAIKSRSKFYMFHSKSSKRHSRETSWSHLSRILIMLGNPWLESHHPLLDTKAATFFLTQGVPTPTTIICDRRLLGISLISYVQARCAIEKGADCTLVIRVYSWSTTPQQHHAPFLEWILFQFPTNSSLFTRVPHASVGGRVPAASVEG